MIKALLYLLFPPKCVLCGKILPKGHMDLCPECRSNAPWFIFSKKSISNVAGWSALWYYKDNVRSSLLRYKFHRRLSYHRAYGRLLAMHVMKEFPAGFDMITWIPVSFRRRLKRGYDQSYRIALTMSKELQIPLVKTLRKTVHNKAQSTITDPAARKANTLGVYRAYKPEQFSGKSILVIDDIVTTGNTASSAILMLKSAGAKNIYFAAVAATQDYKTNR